MRAVMNALAVGFFAFALLTIVVGVANYFAHPSSELAGALAGVFASLFGVVLCILGFVLLGRRR